MSDLANPIPNRLHTWRLSLGDDRKVLRQVDILRADPRAIVDDIGPMLRTLTLMRGSWISVREREAAAWLATHGNWTEEQREEIIRTLSGRVTQATCARTPGKLASRWFQRTFTLSLLVWIVSAVMFMRETKHNPDFVESTLTEQLFNVLGCAVTFTGLTSIITVPISLWYDARVAKRLKQAMVVLAMVGGPDAIFPLANALSYGPLRSAAVVELPGVVERLAAENYGCMPADAGAALCRALPAVTEDTALAILRALGAIGDGQAIYTVEYQAYNSLSSRVRIVAKEILPILYQRRNKSQAPSMLLRAGSAPADGTQTLLRATTEVQAQDPRELLRAGSEGN